MRLKHVFVLAPLLWFVATAGAADTQLKEVSVTAQDSATAVTLETAGPFTHSEYRPQPTMVLVDLQKVSSTSLKQRQRMLDSPAVKSYRVLEYKSVGGVEVTRVELTVTAATKLQVKESKNGLQLLFTTGVAGTASAATQPASKAATAALKPVTPAAPTAAAKPAPAAAKTAPAAARAVANKSAAGASAKPALPTESASVPPIMIRNVKVIRTGAGVAVEIEGAKTARTQRVSDPERLVLDIDNSIPATQQTIAVNAADLKSVRVAQFQAAPPVTRVVLDLAGPREFDLATRGNKLVVTVLPATATAHASATSIPPAPLMAPVMPPVPKLAAPVPAKPVSAEVKPVSPTPHPLGEVHSDQTVVNVVAEKTATMKSAAPVAQVRNDAAQPAIPVSAKAPVAAQPEQKAALLSPPAPLVVTPVQSNGSASAQPKLVQAKLSETPEKPAVAQKNADFVYVSPEFKKQSGSSTLAAVDGASTRAVEAATTVAQNQPAPVLMAQAQPTPLLSAPTAPQKPEPAEANPASTRAVEAATTVAQDHQPAALNAQALNAQVQPQAPTTPQPAANLALEQQKAIANPPPAPPAKTYTGEPISVNLKDVDIKDFFRLIHEISGLNIVLDPNVRGTLTLVLDDVPWIRRSTLCCTTTVSDANWKATFCA